MGRVLKVYDVCETTPHEEATSSGTADPQTIAPPTGSKGESLANAAYLSAITGGCYVTFDGTTATSTNGLYLPSGAAPILILLGDSISFVAATAAGCTLKALWLT